MSRSVRLGALGIPTIAEDKLTTSLIRLGGLGASATAIMTDADLAYAAGIFDGEGTVLISKGSDGTGLLVRITMTDPEAITFLDQTFDGLHTLAAPPRQGNRQCYVWAAWGERASAFLEAIRPYVRVKADQADVAIAYWHQSWRGHRGRGKNRTEDQRQQDIDTYHELRRLKRPA